MSSVGYWNETIAETASGYRQQLISRASVMACPDGAAIASLLTHAKRLMEKNDITEAKRFMDIQREIGYLWLDVRFPDGAAWDRIDWYAVINGMVR